MLYASFSLIVQLLSCPTISFVNPLPWFRFVDEIHLFFFFLLFFPLLFISWTLLTWKVGDINCRVCLISWTNRGSHVCWGIYISCSYSFFTEFLASIPLLKWGFYHLILKRSPLQNGDEYIATEGEKRTVIFSPRVCSDVELEVGNLIRINPPWYIFFLMHN